jgi:ribosomal protein L11 methyltransferase
VGDCTKPSDVSPQQTHPWTEISIDVHPIAHEAVGAFLFDLGCEGIATEGADAGTLKAYLPCSGKSEDIRSRLETALRDIEEIFPEARPAVLRINRIEDHDWSIEWRAHFRSERITPGLLVVPAWEPIPAEPGSHLIRIDPGPAFGTGQHPTTRMCLESLEKFRADKPWTMLDIGTGSGILAIYAAKLGARRVLALDTDLEALRWAEKSIALNEPPATIELSSAPVETTTECFDVVTANLTLDVILQLMPHFSRLLEPQGWLILSGLLREQVERVEERLAGYGFQSIQVFYQQEWACIIAVKMGIQKP